MRDDTTDPEIDWSALTRYVTGDCTQSERAACEARIATSPDLVAWVHAARTLYASADPPPIVADTATSWRRAQLRLGWERDEESHGRVARVADESLKLRPRGVGGPVTGLRAPIPAVAARAGRPQSLIAAMVVIALGVGLAVNSLRHSASIGSPGRTYATTAGQRLSVTLVDGTQFTLAPASRVRVAAAYGRGAGSRDVELEGEAYFAVVHDAAHPFAVRANGAVVRDVGTAFDVRAYPEDAGARIAVADGAVAVSVAGGCLVGLRTGRGTSPDATGASSSAVARESGPCSADARAGDVATVGGGEVALEHEVDVGALAAWRDGRLAFDATPAREVLAELARWYDVDVQLSDSTLGAKPLTATLDTHDPAPRVFEAVAFLLHARVERHGRVVSFSSQVEHTWR